MRRRAAFAFSLFGLVAGSCTSNDAADSPEPPVGLAPDAPWPKFRADAAQTGRARFRPMRTATRPWEVRTDKGIFSSPVIGADGTTYVGSADRIFYAIGPDGRIRWKLLTGEIIDSAALLDDRGRVYFASGDGKLYARDTASGAEVWTMEADDPSVNKAFIRWFEGNVAIGPSGTLYVPNDNFFLYAVDRENGSVRWRFKTPDQTWSLPAVDARTETLYFGNNNVLPLLGKNAFALEKNGEMRWSTSSAGTIAASPALAGDRVFVGGFDGYVRALSTSGGDMLWELPARDHVYASPAIAADGTVIQPAADGTVYALDPATGKVRWTFDIPDPIRSSPAIDGDGNIYFGGGDGRLWVLNPDGTLRWSMRLVDEDRNDLNASPALGRDRVVIAGESGQIFGIPYDWCLRSEGAGDPRCFAGAPPPAAAAELRYVTPMGSVVGAVPDVVDANEPVTLALVVRENGRSKLATLDATSLRVETNPPTDIKVDIAGDGKFVTVAPATSFADGTELRVTSQYLVDHARTGLRLEGGVRGGDVATTAKIRTRPRGAVTLAAPGADGTGGTTWEFRRLALPLPTMMPSYNQIGFDSLHYLLGVVELEAGRGIAWMIGAKLADGENRTVVDPTTRALFPLELAQDGDLVTLSSSEHLRVEITGAVIPFKTFRASARLAPDTNAEGVAKLSGSTICTEVPLYGTFLKALGLCNPQTDTLVVVGGANLVHAEVPALEAGALGEVTATREADAVHVTFAGSRVRAADHVVAVLLVDGASGRPITLDYGVDTARTLDAAGNVSALSVPLKGRALPANVRALVMVDTRRVTTLTLP